MAGLQKTFNTKTVDDFTRLYRDGKLNLNPGFQRNTVWTTTDRKKLIESVLRGFPVPSIFLRARGENEVCYDVLDGKQRLEALLKFQGVRGISGERFSVKLASDKTGEEELLDWAKLRKANRGIELSNYSMQTIEVTGDFDEIRHLFVLLNSTGKRLTSAEKRHAKFFHSEFLKKAATLAEKRRPFFSSHKLLSASQLGRMKHIELLSEIMASVHSGDLIDKKKALDSAMEGKAMAAGKVRELVKEVNRILSLLERMFPDFGGTRFRNAADFYSLFMLIWRLDAEGAILSDERRNKQARRLLVRLDLGTC